MKYEAPIKLPEPGHQASYDHQTDITKVLEIISENGAGNIEYIGIQCVAGNMVGRIANPIIGKLDDGYTITGVITASPSSPAQTFRFYTQGRAAAGKELETISSISVRCR